MDMAQAVGKPDSASLVARILAELEANPSAQLLLLRALLTNEFRGMPLRLDRIEADIREMKVDVAGLKTDVAGLKTDVAGLKTDVAGLKTDVAGLKTDVAGLKTDVAGLKTDVAGLKTDVAGLKGDCLEFKLPRRIRAFLSQRLALRGVRIMQSALAARGRSLSLSPAVQAAWR